MDLDKMIDFASQDVITMNNRDKTGLSSIEVMIPYNYLYELLQLKMEILLLNS